MPNTSLIARLKTNWRAGLTVALVSIPLSVSLAVASKAPPSMGIVTAIWAGLIASLFGGSNYNVIGPTGALSGILAVYAQAHGYESLALLAIVSGILIYLCYLLKFEKYLVFIPGSAIHGFTLGVACIIGLNQLNFALGLSGLVKHESFIANVFESVRNITATSFWVFALFFIALIALFVCKKYIQSIPGAILIAPLGIGFGYLCAHGFFPAYIPTLGSLYPTIGISLFLPYRIYIDSTLIMPALAVALVAIIETMISARIADGMTGTKHHKQKELRGLALANIASGIAGGMPATAALARTALNIKTGATNKISATISSLAIVVISLAFLGYFTFIPLAVIAAILVFVSIQMVEAEHFKRMWKYDRKNFSISLCVAVATIVEDPIVGIIFGVGISLLLLVEKLSRGQFDLIIHDQNQKMVERITGEKLYEIVKDTNTVVYSIAGMLCYINSEAHRERLSKKAHNFQNIILRLRSVYYIDIDGVEAIDEIIRTMQKQGKNVYITSINPLIAEMLNESEAYQNLRSKGHVFEKSSDALKYLGLNV